MYDMDTFDTFIMENIDRLTPSLVLDSWVATQLNINLTVNPGLLPIKGVGVWSLGQAGGGVGSEVHLLGQLYDGDVVVVRRFIVALVVGELRHV